MSQTSQVTSNSHRSTAFLNSRSKIHFIHWLGNFLCSCLLLTHPKRLSPLPVLYFLFVQLRLFGLMPNGVERVTLYITLVGEATLKGNDSCMRCVCEDGGPLNLFSYIFTYANPALLHCQYRSLFYTGCTHQGVYCTELHSICPAARERGHLCSISSDPPATFRNLTNPGPCPNCRDTEDNADHYTYGSGKEGRSGRRSWQWAPWKFPPFPPARASSPGKRWISLDFGGKMGD